MRITELDPRNVFEYFDMICSVPHGSGNTEAIRELLKAFASSHNIECTEDEAGNIVMCVPGTEGKETRNTVILQSHMDMVCVTGKDCKKDMKKEGPNPETDGKKVWAQGTSLGADDGIGIAFIMALITDESIEHPPLEALFTMDEETGLHGANAFDMERLKGKTVINLDSEEEGMIICGCAGGTRIDSFIPAEYEGLNIDEVCYSITIKGLLGGHSGEAVHLHRANAGRLLARIIYGISMKTFIRTVSFESGQFDNAIPNHAYAVVSVPKKDAEMFERLAQKHEKLFRYEYKGDDPDISVQIEKIKRNEYPQRAATPQSTKNMMRMIVTVPDGLRKMSETFKNVAQTSSNAGIFRLNEQGLYVTTLVRSMVTEERDEIIELYRSIVEHDKGKMTIVNSYDPWEYPEKSELRDVFAEVYKEQNGKDAEIVVIHGGLEVGVLAAKKPGLDGVSVGPDIAGAHTDRETLDVRSTKNTYELLKLVLKRL